MLFGTALSAAGALKRLFRRRYRFLVGRDAGGRFDRAMARSALAQGIPLWLVTLISLLYFRGDVLLLRIYASNAELLGAYSAGVQDLLEGAAILPGRDPGGRLPAAGSGQTADRERQRRWERLLVALLLGAR